MSGFVEEVNSTVSLVDDFLNFKTAKEELENEEEKKIFYFAQNLISKLTNNEIMFALNIIEKFNTLNLTKKLQKQKGGAKEIIEFENKNGTVSVKMISRNNFLYYILNIFIVLITYLLISSLFQNTLQLQKNLIETSVIEINNQIQNPSSELDTMNDLIYQLNAIDANSQSLVHTIDLVQPSIDVNYFEQFPSNTDDANNNLFQILGGLYTQVKIYTKLNVESHLPDMNNLISVYSNTKKQLKKLTNMDNGIMTTFAKLLKTGDELQQKQIILQRMVNLFPNLIASYSLKISRVTSEVANIQSLIYGILYRLLAMLAISKFFHKQGNKVIQFLTDKTQTISLPEYTETIEIEEMNKIEKIINILSEILQRSNLTVQDKQMIIEEITSNIPIFIGASDLKEAVKEAVENAVEKLPESDVPLLKGGKPRRQTRRKIRRNKKTKTKKRKVNKKTKKRKKKTKINRKKSKKRRTKK